MAATTRQVEVIIRNLRQGGTFIPMGDHEPPYEVNSRRALLGSMETRVMTLTQVEMLLTAVSGMTPEDWKPYASGGKRADGTRAEDAR